MTERGGDYLLDIGYTRRQEYLTRRSCAVIFAKVQLFRAAACLPGLHHESIEERCKEAIMDTLVTSWIPRWGSSVQKAIPLFQALDPAVGYAANELVGNLSWGISSKVQEVVRFLGEAFIGRITKLNVTDPEVLMGVAEVFEIESEMKSEDRRAQNVELHKLHDEFIKRLARGL